MFKTECYVGRYTLMLTKARIKDAARPLGLSSRSRMAAARPAGWSFPQLHISPSPRRSPLHDCSDTIPLSLISEISLQLVRQHCASGDIVELRENRRLAAYALWAGDADKLHIFEHLPTNISAPLTIDDAYWRAKLFAAWDARRALLPDGTTAFRLVDGHGDGLPGVFVDVYGTTAVVRVAACFGERLGQLCVEFLLQEVLGRDAGVFVSLEDDCGTVLVSTTWQPYFLEHNISLPTRIDAPYLLPDLHLRALRALVRDFAADRRVVTVNDTAAGFAAHAAVALAKRVTVLESRSPAFVEAAQDTLAKVTQGTVKFRKSAEVLPCSLSDFCPADVTSVPESSQADVVVLVAPTRVRDVEARLCTPSTATTGDASSSGYATYSTGWSHEDWLRELESVERLLPVESPGLVVVCGARGCDILDPLLQFVQTPRCRRQWSILKRVSVAVDFPWVGRGTEPFASVFDVTPWRG